MTLGPTAMRTRMDPRAVSFATRYPCGGHFTRRRHGRAGDGSMRMKPWVSSSSWGAARRLGVERSAGPRGADKGPAEYGAMVPHAGRRLNSRRGARHPCAPSRRRTRPGRAAFLAWMPILGAAGLGQPALHPGTLTYLMPVVIGGGPIRGARVGVGVLRPGPIQLHPAWPRSRSPSRP